MEEVIYQKCRNGVPYEYRYGDVEEADKLFFEGGYKTEEEAIRRWKCINGKDTEGE